MYSRVTVATDEVFLDYMVTADSATGDSVTLPDYYYFSNIANTVVVGGAGCEFVLSEAKFTRDGDVLTFDENISNGQPCQVYVGVPIEVCYIPTRPFRRTQEGLVITSDRIRISNWTLSVVDTHEVTIHQRSHHCGPGTMKKKLTGGAAGGDSMRCFFFFGCSTFFFFFLKSFDLLSPVHNHRCVDNSCNRTHVYKLPGQLVCMWRCKYATRRKGGEEGQSDGRGSGVGRRSKRRQN